jgi:multisubunit Na+/H+ antiporter MnhB subunit
VINQAILTAGSVFIATTVLFPLSRRYKAWKASRPEVTMRRDRRGRLVPVDPVRWIERLVVLALVGLAILGLAVGFTVMAPQ